LLATDLPDASIPEAAAIERTVFRGGTFKRKTARGAMRVERRGGYWKGRTSEDKKLKGVSGMK
jgi:hypothetical protein